MAEAPAQRTFCRLYRKLLGPCMRHRLTSMYLLWSQEVRGPWELNLGPSLLASLAKLLCLLRYGKLGRCQEAVSALWEPQSSGAPTFLTNPTTILSASACLLLVQIYRQGEFLLDSYIMSSFH